MDNNIAIIGISLRVPDAKNYDEFWVNLLNAKDSIKYLNDKDLLASGISKKKLRDREYIKSKGILLGADLFEPQLFGITPSEAKLMDPQLRIFLELVWEALEDAGYHTEEQLGIVSVIASQNNKDTYTEKHVADNDSLEEKYPQFLRTINHGNDFLATRTSYVFNFTGVSYTLQTGCSSSLAAVAMACDLIRSQQCDVAIAGGINISVPMMSGYQSSQGLILSLSGVCRPFDVNADGTVPGNGGGVVVLKSLSRAIRDKDNIHAVIQGFGVNNDGRNKVGYAAPSVEGQKKAIIKAMKMASLMPSNINFIEAHGTATVTGDPIEVMALHEAYLSLQPSYSLRHKIVLGSVKSNIGHLYAASGVIGLIKTALALKHRIFPGTLHFHEPNDLLNLDEKSFLVSQHSIFLKNQILFGGVSSFGIGGTNVHMLLRNFHKKVNNKKEINFPVIIPLSARTNYSLSSLASKMQLAISSYKKNNNKLKEIAYTLQTGRLAQPIRLYTVVSTIEELEVWLRKIATSKETLFPLKAISDQLTYVVLDLFDIAVEKISQLCRLFPRFNEVYTSLRKIIINNYNIDISLSRSDRCDQALNSYVIHNAIFQQLTQLGIKFSFCFFLNESLYTAAALSGVLSMENGIKLLYSRIKHDDNHALYFNILKKIDRKPPVLKWLDKNFQCIDEKILISNEFWTRPWVNNDSDKIDFKDKNLVYFSKMTLCDKFILKIIAECWKAGHKINWDHLYTKNKQQKICLPSYPFDRVKYWIEAKSEKKTLTLLEEETIKGGSDNNNQIIEGKILEKVRLCFQESLDIKKIEDNDDFFSLGGDSITNISLIARINHEFGLILETDIIFDNSTPVLLANKVSACLKETSQKRGVESSVSTDIQWNQFLASPTQKRFWFLEKAQDGDFSSYNVPFAYYFSGQLNIEKLQESIEFMVYKHELLRCYFIFDGKEVWVRIRPSIKNFIQVQGIEKGTELSDLIIAYSGIKFDLEKDVLFKVFIIYTSDSSGVLFFNFHHCLMDGKSLDIFFREVSHYYNSLINGDYLEYSPSRYAFSNAAKRHNSWLNTAEYNKQLDYWYEHLKGYRRFNLITDYKSNRRNSFRGKRYEVTLPEYLLIQVKALSRHYNLTLYMLLFGVFNLLIAKYSGTDDIVIGTTVANRSSMEDAIVGPFINTLPIRMKVDSDLSLQEYFEIVKVTCIKAFQNQRIPFDHMVQSLGLPRFTLDNPLYKVMFILQNQNYQLPLVNTVTNCVGNFYPLAQLDLTFNLKVKNDGILISIEYRDDIYKEATVKSYVETYLHLIKQTCNKNVKNLIDLYYTRKSYISKLARKKLIKNMNSMALVIDEFENWVKEYPEFLAFSVDSIKLSYKDLNSLANQLANYLFKVESRIKRVAVICMPRNQWLIVTLLACMKLGWCYIPIDPSYPAERIRQVIERSDSDLTLVSHHKSSIEYGDYNQGQIFIDVEGLLAEILKESPCFIRQYYISQSDPIYRIYTSGSTGVPKLVSITHRNALNLLTHFRDFFSCDKSLKFFSMTSISFDIFFLEFMLPLFSGGSILLEKGVTEINPKELAKLLQKEKPTMLQATPTTWEWLIPYLYKLDHNPCVLVGGETLRKSIAELLYKISNRIYNVYGPTETTVWSILHPVTSSMDLRLGLPIKNTIILILDKENRIVPQMVVGQIYIGGEGVSEGYWKDPHLTREKFIDAQSLGLENINTLFYQTGDMGFYDSEGIINYIGRNNSIMKIRGHRISTLEIETLLDTHPAILSSVVDKKIFNNSEILVAYYIRNKEMSSENISNKLHQFISQSLPVYMVPSHYQEVIVWPKTDNQKINRNDLPAIDTSMSHKSKVISELEGAILEVVQSFLNKPILIEDNLFANGLTSIGVIALHDKLLNIGFNFEVADFFHFPTVAQLYEHFNESAKERETYIDNLKDKHVNSIKMRKKRLLNENS